MPQNLGRIKQMMGMVRSAGNPQAMISQIASQNPQMKQVLDLVNQSGGDPKKAFYSACKSRGVDPESIIKMLR